MIDLQQVMEHVAGDYGAVEYPSMTPQTNDQAYDIVSQIWTKEGKISEAQARATFAYLQPSGPQQIDFPATFTNQFLPK